MRLSDMHIYIGNKNGLIHSIEYKGVINEVLVLIYDAMNAILNPIGSFSLYYHFNFLQHFRLNIFVVLSICLVHPNDSSPYRFIVLFHIDKRKKHAQPSLFRHEISCA